MIWQIVVKHAQWQMISITSMDVDFWEVKYISQKKLNFSRKSCEIDVKAAEIQNFPAFFFITHQKRFFYQNYATPLMSLEVFQCKIYEKLP
jgi:hypothetical protein